MTFIESAVRSAAREVVKAYNAAVTQTDMGPLRQAVTKLDGVLRTEQAHRKARAAVKTAAAALTEAPFAWPGTDEAKGLLQRAGEVLGARDLTGKTASDQVTYWKERHAIEAGEVRAEFQRGIEQGLKLGAVEAEQMMTADSAWARPPLDRLRQRLLHLALRRREGIDHGDPSGLTENIEGAALDTSIMLQSVAQAVHRFLGRGKLSEGKFSAGFAWWPADEVQKLADLTRLARKEYASAQEAALSTERPEVPPLTPDHAAQQRAVALREASAAAANFSAAIAKLGGAHNAPSATGALDRLATYFNRLADAETMPLHPAIEQPWSNL